MSLFQTNWLRFYVPRGTKNGSLQICPLLPVIIWLEDRLQPNTGNTLQTILMVFTRSDITPPKVNQFGWNLDHSEYIVWGWPWHILGAIRAVVSAGESGEIFLSGK